MKLDLQPRRVIRDLMSLDELTGGPGGARRVCWTEGWVAARGFLQTRLADLPVTVEADEAGNLWALLAGDRPETVAIGSHLDSVPHGGWLDGALGVMAALETLRTIAEQGRPPCSVTLVDFADEEGARFGRSLMGSSAVCGTLDPALVRDLRDIGGERLQDVLARYGVDIDAAGRAASRLHHLRAYLELHIEQGPVLEALGLPVATVLGTFGVERHRVAFHGQAGHAGSTPMSDRKDPVLAASRFSLAIRDLAQRHGGVCTIGSVECEPGVATAIAGVTTVTLDQRHADANTLEVMLGEARLAAAQAAASERCTARWQQLASIAPVTFDTDLIEAARSACRSVTGSDHAVTSGPLHDASEMARRVPTVMVFTSSTNGLSHAEQEDTPRDHLALAIETYARVIEHAIADVAGDAPPNPQPT